MSQEPEAEAEHHDAFPPREQGASKRRLTPLHVIRQLNGDLQGVRPGARMIQLAVAAIPRMTFAWLRPPLYRLAGVRIGERTRIFGVVEIEGPGAIYQNVTIGRGCSL